MCLGIPGRIVAITDPERLMAMADVSGVRRQVNVACVAGSDLGALVGQWALIHVGFAMSLIDEVEAEKTVEALRDLGEAQETLAQMEEGERALQ
jgi:hydrogenase expression/formation protein HypC